MPLLPPPPSTLTGPLGDYLQVLWKTVYAIPNMSYFSGSNDPNGNLNGVPGDLGVYIGVTSTNSRLWVKGGSIRQASTSGWTTV